MDFDLCSKMLKVTWDNTRMKRSLGQPEDTRCDDLNFTLVDLVKPDLISLMIRLHWSILSNSIYRTEKAALCTMMRFMAIVTQCDARPISFEGIMHPERRY